MNRRGFIGALIGAAVLDPERLLWIPGKKLISIPNPVQVLRSQTLSSLLNDLADIYDMKWSIGPPGYDKITFTADISHSRSQFEIGKTVKVESTPFEGAIYHVTDSKVVTDKDGVYKVEVRLSSLERMFDEPVSI